MSNLKDTEFEDLFRRASDKYPLRTNSADWDRMAAALEKDPPLPPGAADETDDRRKRRFLWLFLLLPLAGAGYYVWQGHGHGTSAMAGNNIVKTGGTAVGASQGAGSIPGAGAVAGAGSMSGGATVQGAEASRGAGVVPGTATSQGAGAIPGTGNYRGVGAIPGSRTAGNGRNRLSGANEGGQTAEGSGLSDGRGVTDEQRLTDGRELLDGRRLTDGRGSTDAGSDPSGGDSRKLEGLNLAFIPHDYLLAVKVTAPAAVKDSSPSKKPKPASKKPNPEFKHFYAGVLGAPDLSMVRMQSVKEVGSTFGVLLGYSFNSRWSIETGAYVDRKHYYTDGEYFSTKEVPLPTNTELTSVNGVCYMWEIPLNVRYNFNPGGRTAWFATAGVSTYLMSREKYAMGWKWYNSNYIKYGNWNIDSATQYPFSVINLSAGFEQRLGKVGSLRLEPYVRIPLTGMGAGKLPIMSVGVNVGITRRLW